jgi:hypothetical protein
MGSTATRIVIVHKQSGLRDSNGNSLSPRLNMDQGTQPGSSLLSLQRSSLVYNQSKSKLKTLRSKNHSHAEPPQPTTTNQP